MNSESWNHKLTRRQALTGAAVVGSAPILASVVTPKAVAAPLVAAPSALLPAAGIRSMLGEISSANIKATIEKLVSFGTRNTMSS